jgi:hypothetical protein
VEGIRHCGREEAVWSRSCSCRHSEASRRGPGEREEVGDAKPEEGRDAGEVHTGTVPRRGQFVAEKETFFSRLSALAVAREPRLGVTWVLAPSNVFRLSSRAGRKWWTGSWNQAHLYRRMAWPLQAQALGGLSERAQRRAGELAEEASLRLRAPRPFWREDGSVGRAAAPARDERLPPIGTVLQRNYCGETIEVEVLARGFGYRGQVYGR